MIDVMEYIQQKPEFQEKGDKALLGELRESILYIQERLGAKKGKARADKLLNTFLMSAAVEISNPDGLRKLLSELPDE